MALEMLRSMGWIVLLLMDACLARAAPVDATFIIDQRQSSLTIDASTVFVFPLNDSDTQPLTGSIETTLDFGTSGTLPADALITVNGAAISPLADFSLTLGLPPLLGVNVSISGAVADITTPKPPAPLEGLPTGLVRYQFDAADFEITLNQGIVSVTGRVNQTSDLSAMPVSGTAEQNTFGQITFLDINTNGPLTEIDALLELPILFTEVLDVDDQLVTLNVAGDIFATSSFAVALSSLVDSDNDGDVDGGDFLFLQQDNPSMISDWQVEYPEASGQRATAQSVPEPSTLLLSLVLLACAVGQRNQAKSHAAIRYATR